MSNYEHSADMRLGQFSVAVGAPRRWVQNAIAALGLEREYTTEGAKRLALAHLLNRALRIPLVHADSCAADALAAWPGRKTWEHRSEDGTVSLVVDLEHFLSGFAVRLSLARSWYSERRRGRPRKRRRRGIAGAREYGVDITLLEQALRRTHGERLRRLEEAARFFRSAQVER